MVLVFDFFQTKIEKSEFSSILTLKCLDISQMQVAFHPPYVNL